MNTQEMLRILDSIARDRNIDRTLLIRDLEQAMVSAARKYFNTLDLEEFACTVDPVSGEFKLTRHGEPLEMPPTAFGRIAAQTFKQVMIQKFRDDERNTILEDFSKRMGEIVTGTAQRYEGGSLVVMIDRAEGFMPRSEQIPGEQFAAGDRVRCLILDVRDAGSQVKIVLSRGHPDFIKRLFEVEVPEVAEKVIEIKAMAREAGYRTKMAVVSIDSKVDPVGACVGVRGSRIKNIVDELNGEKIDIVRWNESSQILIANALKPAEVQEVSLCFELGRATVVVRDDQLSLAIGKRGQNVRLAARLTGWDVDILTPEEFTKGIETMYATVQSVEGINEKMADKLAALGMVSVFDVEEVGAEVLVSELEIDEALAATVVETCGTKAKEVAEQQQKDKEEKERLAREQAAAGGELAAGDAAAAAILGGGGGDGAPDAKAEDRVKDILGS
jgi:N utilization substance protein A